MPFNVNYNVPAPIEFYDQLHAAINHAMGDDDDGLLVHIGRIVPGGFEVIEVWERKEDYERFVAEVLPKALAAIPGAGSMEPPQPQVFEIRGLILNAKQKVHI